MIAKSAPKLPRFSMVFCMGEEYGRNEKKATFLLGENESFLLVALAIIQRFQPSRSFLLPSHIGI